MQILHNEAEAYDDLLQEVFFHAIDRYDVSCHSSNGLQRIAHCECEAFHDDLRSLLYQHLARLPPHQQR
jgi:hypothetical protein